MVWWTSFYVLVSRDIFISDIYRSLQLDHSSTYVWRGITLARLSVTVEPMSPNPNPSIALARLSVTVRAHVP
jgi:hypothetical protein